MEKLDQENYFITHHHATGANMTTCHLRTLDVGERVQFQLSVDGPWVEGIVETMGGNIHWMHPTYTLRLA
jgi:hypothetical protein